MQSSAGTSRRWWVWNGVLLLLSLLPIVVVVSWVNYRMHHTISDEATIKGNVSLVGARIEGRVKELLVGVNQRVEKGQLLARLDDQHLQAALREAEIEKQRAEQEVAVEREQLKYDRQRLSIELSRTESQVQVSQSAVTSAQSSVARWEREQARFGQIKVAGAISKSELDEVVMNEQQAAADLAAAEAMLATTHLARRAAETALQELAVREARLGLLERSVALAEAKLERVRADLEAAEIRSPVDGWVGHCVAGAGTSLRTGDAIMALWADNGLWVEAWVDESRLANLGVGSEVTVKLPAHPSASVVGVVEGVGVLSDQELRGLSSQTTWSGPQLRGDSKVSVRIKMPDTEVALMPGLSAIVGIRNPDAGSTSVAQWLRSWQDVGNRALAATVAP